MFYVQNISTYMNFEGYGEDVQIPPYIFCLLFKKTEKVQEYDLYLNQIVHHFDSIFVLLWWIIILQKGGSRGPSAISLRSEYSSSNWFHCNTPGYRHLFNTNNTNMYLIHFHSKNIIKTSFPKSWVFYSYKTAPDIHYPSQCGEINCVDISKDCTTWDWNLI